MAVPAAAAANTDHASDTAAAKSADSNAGGQSADHANDNAGANANAANNPHADASSSTPAADNSSPAVTSSAATTSSSSATTTAGNSNAGCHQTAYGATGPGANHSGPYDDTCDGSPSLNGNGGGKATGKPCAGCVGKADEKNPKGQYPNGSDHNKGYECDGNNGIGKTNPAHTGCKTPPPPPPPPGTPPSTPPTDVLGETVTRTPHSAQVLGETFNRAAVLGETVSAGSLPRTGSNLMDPALFGALLLALGSLMARLARRRPTAG